MTEIKYAPAPPELSEKNLIDQVIEVKRNHRTYHVRIRMLEIGKQEKKEDVDTARKLLGRFFGKNFIQREFDFPQFLQSWLQMVKLEKRNAECENLRKD